MPTDVEVKAVVEATIQEWRTNSQWGKYFHASPYNWGMIRDTLTAVKGPLSVEKLDKVYIILLSYGFDLTKDIDPNRGKKPAETPEQREQRETAKAQQEHAARNLKAQAEAAAEKKLFATWEAGLPGMNSLQVLQYSTAMKEDYMRRKHPRAVPDPNAVHPDTVRNTRHAIKMEQAREERQAQSRAASPIQARGEHAQLPFIQAELARAEAERNKI